MIPTDTPIFLNSKGCPTNTRTTTFALILKNNADDDSLFSTASRRILSSAKAICQNNVSASYVEGSLEECDYLAVLCHYSLDMPLPITPESLEEQPESIVYGFATCIDKRLASGGDDNSIYIDVICSNLIGNLSMMTPRPPPGGKTILNLVTTFGKENGYRYIALSALINVINYYRKLGFRHIKNGETTEPGDITRLANINLSTILSDNDEARLRIKVERAYKLAHELNRKGRPEFNEKLFWDTLQRTVDDDTLQGDYDEDTAGDYLAELPSHVYEANGDDGLYDLVGSLIRHGFSSEKCSDVTRRRLVRLESNKDDDDTYYAVACSTEGFSMRKPLFPVSEHGIDDDIIHCDTNSASKGGRRKRRYTKRCRRQRKTKSRSSHRRKTRRH